MPITQRDVCNFMNVFQEVFASVNARSREILRDVENHQPNRKKAVVLEWSKPRMSLADPKSLEPSGTQESAEPEKRDVKAKKYSLPPRMDRLRLDLCSESSDVPDLNSSRSKYAALQSQIATVAEQIQIVEGSLRLAHSQNAELARRNSELECHIASLRQAAAESNKRMVHFKAQFAQKAAEVEDGWEFQLNELTTELASLGEKESSIP
jgi:chromosome segregation ATPase